MGIASYSMIHFERSQLLNEFEADFLHYAGLIRSAESDSNPAKLEAYQEILGDKDVEYAIFDAQGQLEYPETSENFRQDVDQSEIERLANGKIIYLEDNRKNFSEADNDIVAVYIPIIRQNGHFAGFIGVGRSAKYIDAAIKGVRWNVFKSFILSTIVAIIISVIFTYLMVKRVNRLSNAAQKVATGDYDIYIDHSNRDEIDRLSADFNKMIKALKEWRKEVLHLENQRKKFMQDAVHEMRTPLTTINGLLEGLEYGVFDEEQEMRSIKIMSKETKRLIRLVNENLDYENIQSNRIILNKQHFPLMGAMEEIVQQLSTITHEANNEIVIEGDTEEISVYADFDRFKQIIVNLLKNAIQFTDGGVIKVRGYETPEFTYVTVSDSGIGMTEDEMKNIWERYYKSDPSRKNTKYGESGLGLPIVKQLMELHDGKITVESELGKGSKFTLAFPNKRVEKANEIDKTEQ